MELGETLLTAAAPVETLTAGQEIGQVAATTQSKDDIASASLRSDSGACPT